MYLAFLLLRCFRWVTLFPACRTLVRFVRYAATTIIIIYLNEF
jgi:hypothetical protein